MSTNNSKNQNTRSRPTHHQDERSIKMTILNEMEEMAQTRIKSKGSSRVALSPKLKLEWSDCEEGFYYHWASDSENYPINLQQMCDAGYTFVRHKHGSAAGELVIQNSKGCQLYLMRCPQAYFEEDQAIKNAKSIAQHAEISQVGSREYAGSSKELGQGKVAQLSIEENPDAIRLMEGD